jgi:hypothetical protein
MIALITSCIDPVKERSAPIKSFFNTEERLGQTIHSINKLKTFPFRKIYLLDNSYKFDFPALADEVDGVLLRHFRQYQFGNKGINELLLLLAILEELPENEEIFKISGRYYPDENFVCQLDKGFDFKFKGYHFPSKKGTVSTRAYFVKNKAIYEQFLLKCLGETFSYTKRMVGLRSMIDALKQTIKPVLSSESNTAIEFAAARVLKSDGYKVKLTDRIGVEGQIAGFKNQERIKE